MEKRRIALFGGGPACLIAALHLGNTFHVDLYEKGKAVGRKFLVAGNGGFNLTNGANGDELLAAYSPDVNLKNAITNFDSMAVRAWLKSMGVPTFVGSSGRVFPEKGIKPAQVLKIIKDQLRDLGVQVHLNHSFSGFDSEGKPLVNNGTSEVSITADAYVFGLGGGSWSKTGANSQWLAHFKKQDLDVLPFESANCGVQINWSQEVKAVNGTPLKNIAVTLGKKTVKGEAIITPYGLEGNAIYPIASAAREEIKTSGFADLWVDFKPNNSVANLVAKVKGKAVKPKNYGYLFNLSKADLKIIKGALDKETYLNPEAFARQLKALQLKVVDIQPVEEAISTVGGIVMNEVTADFELVKQPNTFVIGEMLNWDAPTGGFLLQGCFSMGVAVAKAIQQRF